MNGNTNPNPSMDANGVHETAFAIPIEDSSGLRAAGAGVTDEGDSQEQDIQRRQREDGSDHQAGCRREPAEYLVPGGGGLRVRLRLSCVESYVVVQLP
ncbi:hypothetical protein QJS04_geneDACA004083 [Acorus gramineus]|uniref:Uncharacterized protein n=1 Tax=Acorus gramineus TaxID=55184 RepID=A0AAV9BJ24_ACOGR|nr:hypothetical protein QJS04_geneDACA004083 [Acorus gramineus]